MSPAEYFLRGFLLRRPFSHRVFETETTPQSIRWSIKTEGLTGVKSIEIGPPRRNGPQESKRLMLATTGQNAKFRRPASHSRLLIQPLTKSKQHLLHPLVFNPSESKLSSEGLLSNLKRLLQGPETCRAEASQDRATAHEDPACTIPTVCNVTNPKTALIDRLR